MGRTIARVPKCNAIALRTNVQRIYSSLVSFTFTLTIECGLIVGGGSSDNVQHIVWILILCIQVYVYGVIQLSARILGYKKNPYFWGKFSWWIFLTRKSGSNEKHQVMVFAVSSNNLLPIRWTQIRCLRKNNALQQIFRREDIEWKISFYSNFRNMPYGL